MPELEASETAQPEAITAASTEPAPATTVAHQGANVAPEATPPTRKATRAKKVPKPAASAEKPAWSGPRESSKTAQLIEMLQQAGGATLEQMCTKFGWQTHTTRAMLSAGGSLTKKHGLKVVSAKAEDGQRTYSLAS